MSHTNMYTDTHFFCIVRLFFFQMSRKHSAEIHFTSPFQHCSSISERKVFREQGALGVSIKGENKYTSDHGKRQGGSCWQRLTKAAKEHPMRRTGKVVKAEVGGWTKAAIVRTE